MSNTLRDMILDIDGIADETRSLFAQKSKDYGESETNPMARFLGLRGQFSDINRKFWKLKRALWDGEELDGEDAVEICMDMIGHCWLTIAMIRDGERKPERKSDIDLTSEETTYLIGAIEAVLVSTVDHKKKEILRSVASKIEAANWEEDHG